MTHISPHTLSLNPENAEAVAAAAAEALRKGQLVVMPTDTVYGLAADPRVEGAHERLINAKGRDEGKPIAYLAGSLEQVETFGAQINDVERRLAQTFWPGALTLILKMPSQPQDEDGFRVPNHAFTLMLLAQMGIPLLVTSANVSGSAPAPTIDEATQQLGSHVSLFVDGGEATGGQASSVVRASGSDIELLREEALSKDDLAGAFDS